MERSAWWSILASVLAACAPGGNMADGGFVDDFPSIEDTGTGALDSGRDSATPPTDSGRADARPAGDGGTTSGLPAVGGMVRVYLGLGTPMLSGANGGFYEAADPSMSPCPWRRINASCTVTNCKIGAAGQPSVRPLSAGALMIGSTTSGTPVRLTPDARGVYNFQEQGARWKPGDTVRIQAAGGPDGVPAFNATIKLPPGVTVTAPTASSGTVAVTRSAGITARWTAVDSDVRVYLYQDQGAAVGSLHGLTAECVFKGSTGAGSIPAAALSNFATTGSAGAPYTQVGVQAINTVPINAGSVPVSISGVSFRFSATASVQ